MFSPELRTQAQALIDRYPVGRSALLPLLHLVQHQDGHLSADGIAECAELLGLTKAEVAAVATFYTMYKREPLGEHLVSVCTNFSCKVRGAAEVYARLSSKLGVGHNGTTADGKFTLEHAECLGNCEGAPVVTVDYLNYECVTPGQAEELVERVAAGEIPPPTRGFPPPGIRTVQYRLAGLGALAASGRKDAPAAERAAALEERPAPGDPDAAPDADAVRAEVRESHQEPADVEGAAGGHARELPLREEQTHGGQAGSQQQDRPTDPAPRDQGADGG